MRPWLFALVAILPVGGQAFDAAVATDRFGFDLARRVQAGGGAENWVLSPYSIESALAMAYVGARGQTRTEMAKVLGLPDDDAAVADGLGRLGSQLQVAGQLDFANRVFGQKREPFRAEYLALLAQNFHAPLVRVDFAADPEGSRAAINDWISERTEGRIPGMLPAGAIRPEDRVVLVNAVYFNGKWQRPFKAEDTRPEPFHVPFGKARDVPTMHATGYRQYLPGNGFVAVAIPYRSSSLEFVAILPDEGMAPAQILPRITIDFFKEVADGAGPQPRQADQLKRIDLALPKFAFPAPTVPLRGMLTSLGMRSAFKSEGVAPDFSGAAEEPLAISEVFHQAMISLDEEGTVAAASTAVGSVVSAEVDRGIPVSFDRPFLFAIEDTKTGLCLFLGQVVDPTGGSSPL